MLNVQQKYNLKQIVSLWVAVCKPQTLCWAPRGINCTKWGSRNIWKCPEKYWHLTKLPFAFHKLVLIVINHQLSTNKSLFSLNSSKFLMSDLKGRYICQNSFICSMNYRYWINPNIGNCNVNPIEENTLKHKVPTNIISIVLNYLIQTK